MIFRTRFVFSNAARPVSPLPALLLTIVRSRAPCSITASTSAAGRPAPPKPPIMIVAPSLMPATAAAADSTTLLTTFDLATCYSLLAACYLLLATCCLLLAARYSHFQLHF